MGSFEELWASHSAVVVVTCVLLLVFFMGWMGYLPGCVSDWNAAEQSAMDRYHKATAGDTPTTPVKPDPTKKA